ncbi:F-box protein At4g09920-like [Silene latifolia]|uniref:F-box protein At4g09920-like n=1 Tax=Silene latifolia TaxID=37657 RepID=UPI003D77C383
MAVKDKVAKRRRTNSNSEGEGGDRGEDRLSTLSDDILIEIISYLPLRLAIVTGSLSRRWRGLWTNRTSIDINNRTLGVSPYKFSFYIVFRNITKQIRSPSIQSFFLELDMYTPYWETTLNSWLHQICCSNVQQLKLTWPDFYSHPKPILPCNFFQVRSLVSVELDQMFGWVFPENGDQINLPNLKKLSLKFHGSQHKCIEKLIKMSPLLEDLSLKLEDKGTSCNIIMNYSHQNLRRLSLKLDINYKTEVVINAPKLDYFDVCGRYDTVFCFEEEPVALSEAKIQLDDDMPYVEGKRSMIQFYEAISNVETLTLDVLVLHYISTVFSNATRLKLNMRTCYKIEILSSLLDMCPALDVLTIKFGDVSKHFRWNLNPPKHDYVRPVPRVLKRIEIEYFLGEDYYKPVQSFLELVEYLLFSSSIASEHFNFSLTGDKYREMECVDCEKRLELDLCKVFNKLPLIWIEGEIEFVGEYFKMSRRAGPKVRGASRKVINFSCSSGDNFKF